MKNLLIVGAGGFGREVAWLATESQDAFNVIGFLDDRVHIAESELGGVPHVGSVSDWPQYAEAEVVVAIGSPRVRAKVVARMESVGIPSYAVLVHRRCMIGPKCNIGPGSIICGGCILTTNIKVGKHVVINLQTTIGHDCVIGALTTIAPHVAVSGCVSLHDGVEIGTGASIRQGVRVGVGSMLGMGSVLTKNMPENTMWFGNPAKHLKSMSAFES